MERVESSARADARRRASSANALRALASRADANTSIGQRPSVARAPSGAAARRSSDRASARRRARHPATTPLCADGLEEDAAEVFRLARAHAFHREQRRHRRGPQPRHLAQRRVVEDHVRRHAARARDVETQTAQPLEQRAIDALPRLRLGTRPLARLALLRHALPRERQPRNARLVLEQRDSLPPSSSTPDTHRRSAEAGRGRSAARCIRALPRPTRRRAGRTCSACRARARRSARSSARAARWRRAWRRTAARRGRRTTGSCAR